MCPQCSSLDYDWTGVSGRGVVYSYVIVRHPVHPAIYEKDQTPYNLCMIELEEQEGLRICSNVLNVAPDDIRIDMPVRVTLHSHSRRAGHSAAGIPAGLAAIRNYLKMGGPPCPSSNWPPALPVFKLATRPARLQIGHPPCPSSNWPPALPVFTLAARPARHSGESRKPRRPSPETKFHTPHSQFQIPPTVFPVKAGIHALARRLAVSQRIYRVLR